MPTPTTKANIQVRELVFAELAVREEILPAETVAKGLQAVAEMGDYGIHRTLPSVLIERKLAEREQVKRVADIVSQIEVRCARCHARHQLSALDKEGRIRCKHCSSVLELALAEGSSQAKPLEARLQTAIVETPKPGTAAAAAAAAPAAEKPSGLLKGSTRFGDFSPQSPAPSRREPAPESAEKKPEPRRRKPRVSARSAIQRFQLEKIIHNGPFGRLYRATLSGTDGEAALVKVIHSGTLDGVKGLDRLQGALKPWNSARGGVARVPHVVQQENSVSYVVRALLDSPFRPLSDFRLSGSKARAQMLRALATALAAQHDDGVVHGNLKPSNVFVKAAGEAALALFVDPALPVLIPEDHEVLRWQILAKSPSYRSPEEILGRPASFASDVYALGALFHTVLSGAAPFAGVPAPEALRQQIHGPLPPTPREESRWQPLIERMLAFAPEERPQTGADVLRLVEAVFAGKTLERPRLSPRPQRTAVASSSGPRRRRFDVRYALGPAALAAVIAWVGWCGFQGNRAAKLLSEAHRAEALYLRYMEAEYLEASEAALLEPTAAATIFRRFHERFPDSPYRGQPPAPPAEPPPWAQEPLPRLPEAEEPAAPDAEER